MTCGSALVQQKIEEGIDRFHNWIEKHTGKRGQVNTCLGLCYSASEINIGTRRVLGFRSVYNFMRSDRRLGVGLANKKRDCTGSSGELMPSRQTCSLTALDTYSLACRVIEVATVEAQISLHEQNSLTPASGTSSTLALHIITPTFAGFVTSRHVCCMHVFLFGVLSMH